MNYSSSCLPMEVLENKSEIVRYTVPGLPVRSVRNWQTDYPTLSVVNHWHTDFEFTLVVKGRMFYMVNGQQVEITKGDMLFVNSSQMHYSFWKQVEECELICTIFHPSLLKGAEKYFEQISGRSSVPFILFRSSSPSDAMIIQQITALHKLCEERSEGDEFFILSTIYKLCGLLYNHIANCPAKPAASDRKKLEALHRMTGFIQQNYGEKLSLQMIAEAGFISRSVCCNIFRTYLRKTPVQYLNAYRISKSIELLSAGGMSMTEIAEKCGFGSSSYFSETFRSVIGMSPGEYVKKYL